MFDEFLLEVFFIKIKVKTTLKSLTDSTEEKYETTGIKNKNKLIYYVDKTKYAVEIKKQQVVIKRENEEFTHGMLFDINQITSTEYYIKELGTSLLIKIKTKNINITDNEISINYETIDNNSKYIYKIEMSDNNEYKKRIAKDNQKELR